nr:LOB domain-containing protein 2-like [Ipomoea batatas]GMC88240.1 LOB domain-containing protein 2-like [Ipomoea batatas]
MEKNKDDNEASNSNSPACAACRHQRKQCKAKDCVLWPHFPSDRMVDFLAVHRVFGISNVTKMLRELSNDERAAAAASLLWEAHSWTEDPVHGPLGKFNRLEQELNALKASLFQYQPAAMDATANTSLVPMGVKESLVISNGGFPQPYPANFGQRWSDSVTPYKPQEIVASCLQLPQQQPPINPPIPGLIRGDEYFGTMYSVPPDLPFIRDDDFVGTNFSSPPIRGEDNIGTSFNSRLSRSNVKEDGGTIFSTSPSFPIRREDRVGTSFNRLSRSNNVRGTVFSTSPSLQISGKDRVGTSFNRLSRFNVRGEENFSNSPSLWIKEEDKVGTSFNNLSGSNVRGEENCGTIFSTSPSLPIKGKDKVGTSFNSLSPFNFREDQDNLRTQFTSSVNLPVKRDGDPAAFRQQHTRNSNTDDARGRHL